MNWYDYKAYDLRKTSGALLLIATCHLFLENTRNNPNEAKVYEISAHPTAVLNANDVVVAHTIIVIGEEEDVVHDKEGIGRLRRDF